MTSDSLLWGRLGADQATQLLEYVHVRLGAVPFKLRAVRDTDRGTLASIVTRSHKRVDVMLGRENAS